MHVYYREQGQREPGLGALMVLAKTLKVPLDGLAQGLAAPTERRPPAKRKGHRA